MIGIYCRVSTEQQANEGLSLDIQKEKGIKFALAQHEDYHVYTDAGISGGTFEREQFQKLITDITAKKVDKVYVVSKDRLTRASLVEAIGLRDFFREKKVKLYIDGQLNGLESPEDLLQSNILDSIAEFQRLLTKKKSKEGRQKQIDAGENSFCMVYGYDYRVSKGGKKEWYINEDEAKLIRYIYQMYFENLTFDQICKRLAAEGYKTKRKGNWDIGTIHLIMRRAEYIGMTHNTKGELVESKHYKSIMDRETWERVQKTIDEKIRIRKGKHFRTASYALSGILRCSKCHAGFFFGAGVRLGNRREKYAHKQITPEQCACTQTPFNVNRNIIDYLMRAMFVSTFESHEEIARYMEKLKVDINKETSEIQESIIRVEKLLKELDIQRKRLVDAIKTGVLEVEDVRDEMEEIRSKTNQYRDSIENLHQELLLKSANTSSILNSFAEDLVEKLNKADEKQKREMYIKYCKTIEMNGYTLEVEYITGQKLAVNMKAIPDSYMNEMIRMKYFDLHPDEHEIRVDNINDAIYHSMPESYYLESSQLKETFILHTKGRPKKRPA